MPPEESPVPPIVAPPAADAAGATPAAGAPVARWAARTFAALRHRDYRRFFTGMALSSIGTWGRQTAQQWLVWDLTGSERWLAATSAASLLATALVSVPAGALSDRVDRRRLLLWIQVVEMLLSATLAVLVATGVARAGHVLVVAAALGACFGLEMPCRQAFVADLVDRDTLRNAIALNSLMFNLPLVVGPAIAAGLMTTFGIASVFAFDAVTYVATIVAFASIRPRPPAVRAARAGVLDELLAGVRHVARDRAVRTILLLLAAAMVFGWSYGSLLAAYARDGLGLREGGYGLLFLSSGVGACLAALWVAGRHPPRPVATIVRALLVFAASLAVLAAVRHPVVAVASRTVAGAAMIVFFATGASTIQLAVPDAIRGRVMALWTFTFAFSLPVGQLFLGEVARATSVPTAYGVGAATVTAAVLLVAALGSGSGLPVARPRGPRRGQAP